MTKPTVFFYRMRFGSWKNALQLAELTPRKPGGDRGRWAYKRERRNRIFAAITEAKKHYWLQQEKSA